MIRVATYDDVDAIVALTVELNDWVWSHANKNGWHDVDKYRKNILDSLAMPDRRYLLYVKGGKVIGYCASGVQDRGIGLIGSLVITNSERDRGYGVRLARHATQWLRQRDCRLLTFNIAVSNPVGAIALRLGFVCQGSEFVMPEPNETLLGTARNLGAREG